MTTPTPPPVRTPAREGRGARRTAALTLLLALVGGVLVSPAPASAVAPTSAPVLTAPSSSAEVSDGPVLSWNRIAGAAAYDVEVSTDSGFSTTLFAQSTTNLHATPLTELPVGPLHWRVRGKDAGGAAGPWATSIFSRATLAVPQLSTPADGATLAYPSEPPVLSWSPSAGAAQYRVEIDDSSDFVSPILQTLTSTTSYTMTAPQTVDQPVYWRVHAVSAAGTNSEWSQVRSYATSWDAAPALVLPAPGQHVTDVVLEWTAVLGAAAYELQVSPNGDWANNLSIGVTVKGTRYSPAVSLNNSSYFWRVRAVDGARAANKAPWSAEGLFHREWTPVPQLLRPADGDFAAAEPTFVWTPIGHASRYELQVGTDVNFSPGTFTSCRTDHTTYTPYRRISPFEGACPVDPAPGQTYHWRVRGIDDPYLPGGILGRWSATSSFLYRKPLPVVTGPADGTTTGVPVLSWNPVADADKYVVTVLRANGTAVLTHETWATSYSPLVDLRPEDGPFSWYVRSKDANGHLGMTPAREQWRTFSLVEPAPGSGSLPHPVSVTPTAGSSRMPSLRWTPVTGAVRYTVHHLHNGVYTPLHANVPYAALSDPDRPLAVGTFEWFVEAFDKDGGYLGRGSTSTYRITESALATYTAPCRVGEVCATQRDTPTLSWQSVDRAGSYLVTLALDPAFTNVHREFTTQYTSLTPRESLMDNQAGQSYYWFVRACAGGLCGPFGAEQHGTAATFRKESARVEDLRVTGSDSRLPVLSWRPYLTARQYKVQVSATQDFAVLLDEATVDQTTYTPWNKTYPVGPLFARVQAVDGSGNLLTSSAPISLVRTGPAPLLSLPADGATVEGVPYLQWEPEHYAARYDVEVYKNGDTAGSLVNRVLSAQTALSAWSPTTGLAPGSYAWRVRRLDVDGRVGPWSAGRLFALRPAGVQLTAPSDAAVVSGSLLFSWLAVPGAARYRWEGSTSSSFTAPTRVDTSGTSYAPTTVPIGTRWWRVSTLDARGTVLSTSAVRSVTTELPGSRFVAVPPVRLLDTRTSQPVGPGGTLDLQVTGRGQVPVGAEAVVVNLTAVSPTASSHVTAYPTGEPRPTASTLNNRAGTTRPNLAVVKLGAGGRISLFNAAGSTHLLADVAGYYSSTAVQGTRYTAVAPVRTLDTRTAGRGLPLGPGGSVTLDITDGTLVPSDATAVTVNVTAVAPSAAGYVTVHPSGTPRPTVSNLNLARGVTAGNLVTVQTGTATASRAITLYNSSGSTHLLVDLAGYYSAASASPFTASTPTRMLDTRRAVGVTTTTPVRSGGTVNVDVRAAGVPAGAKAVVFNLTSTGALRAGSVTAYPGGTARPPTVSLSVVAGDTRPNLVVAKVGPFGTVGLYNGAGDMHLVADVAGWFE
ncbi:MAG: hypothetical protein AVDCRST_MAG16-1549 [uncultured Frankineae bacterium]|uniref:Fibronectin type-III domain-containing protein n=1 Tax=uncultured Frankineae bacterium TaxID=437475 RepID=A0A6J4LJT9_9ACTN|nr:MAG: hypothetical protein AVDCRST_MAG16-1549 [uncultured Frankineae bacterium]